MALKYLVQDIQKSGHVYIAVILLERPEDVRFYILRNPEDLNGNREFEGFEKEKRVRNVEIHELIEKEQRELPATACS